MKKKTIIKEGDETLLVWDMRHNKSGIWEKKGYRGNLGTKQKTVFSK